MRLRRGISSVALLGVLTLSHPSALAADSRSPAGTPPPFNVVLVSIDSLRADHLPMYGYPRDTTPTLARLASLPGARTYTRVTSVAPSCHPSHTTILTGLYPQQVGVPICGEDLIFKPADMDDDADVEALEKSEDDLRTQPESFRRKKRSAIMNWLRIPENVTTLPMFLQRRGFQTGGFVSIWTLQGRFGYSRGFDQFDDEMPEYYGPPKLRWLLGDVYRSQLRRPGEDTVNRALEFLDATSRDRPFFLFLHLADTHVPYRAPPGARLPEMTAAQRSQLLHTWMRRYPKATRDRAFERMNVGTGNSLLDRYDLAIHHTDALIGRLLNRLKALGVLSNTLIIVTADHGDSFGQHPYLSASQHHRLFFEHSVYVWEETQHVPLIIRDPRQLGAPVRVPGNVSLVDIVPTVLSALGYGDSQLTPGATPGINLLATVRRRRVYFVTFGRGRPGLLDTVRTDYPNYIGFREGDTKFFVDKDRFKNPDKGKCFLFDLATDPNELNNDCEQPEFAARSRAWRNELVEWYNNTLKDRPKREPPSASENHSPASNRARGVSTVATTRDPRHVQRPASAGFRRAEEHTETRSDRG